MSRLKEGCGVFGHETELGARPARQHSTATLWLLCGCWFVLLLFRRGQQLVEPQVWAEDGTVVIPGLLARGAASLLDIGGAYLLLVPKLIAGLALATSITLLPFVGTVVAWAVTIAVLALIARHPSTLAGGPLLAFAVLMIPTDAEVFGVPLYALWWAGLAQLVPLVWRADAGGLGLRIGCVVLGGLSSPFIVGVWPAFVARAWMHRRLRGEWLVAAVATACSGLQVLAVRLAPPELYRPVDLGDFRFDIVPTFFGRYLVGEFTNSLPTLIVAALVVLAVVAAGLWHTRRNAAVWVLVYLLLVSIGLSVARVGCVGIHPVFAGPRYFFFPFIMLSWLLLQIACDHTARGWLRGTAAGLLLMSVVNAVPHFGRFHDDLRWRDHLATSVHFDRYAIPAHLDGAACHAWHFTISGSDAAALLARDPARGLIDGARIYPHSIGKLSHRKGRERAVLARIIPGHKWDDVSQVGPVPAVFSILRSPAQADVPLSLDVHRGGRILFRSSERIPEFEMAIEGTGATFATDVLPSTEWQTFEFSNRLLPERFTVTLRNRGDDPGRWVEIGVPAARPGP